MAMINVIVLIFLAFMAYWWSAQGLFSAVLHLISVIIAGTLAFALWEPATNALLQNWAASGRYAWGATLIIMFVFFLMVIRIAFDKLVPKNMHFRPIVNTLGGIFLGLLAGMLTAGITVLGISFMGVGPTFGGYQPLAITTAGAVEPYAEGDLWVGVDTMAANFFTGLSTGAFRSKTPLATYQPDLARQAWLYRMHIDSNASVSIVPDSVVATDLIVIKTPVEATDTPQRQVIGSQLGVADMQAVIVLTKWTKKTGTYDTDQTLRVAATQIQLVTSTTGEDEGDLTLYTPIAGSKRPGPTAPSRFYLFNDDKVYLSGANQEEIFGWVFVIPKDQKPQHLLVRHSRLPLPDKVDNDPLQFVRALGTPGTTASAAGTTPPGTGGMTPGTVGPPKGTQTGSAATNITISDELPKRASVVMKPTTIKLNEQKMVTEGSGEIRPVEGHVSMENMFNRIASPSHMKIVRVELTADRAQSVLGGALSSAASLGGPTLTDSNGNVIEPLGYVWLKADGRQQLQFEVDKPIRTSRDLPVRDMKDNDFIYLYFMVQKGVTIVKYSVGNTSQETNLPVN